MPTIKTILVDLTPVLPGGENGGAKVFVLELLKNLAQLQPKTKFIVLTQAAAKAELKNLERDNLITIALGGSGKKSLTSRIISFALRKIPFIPRKVSLLGYRMFNKLRKRGVQNIISTYQPDLIFCPFTAPTFAQTNIPTVCIIYDLQYKTHPLFFERADMLNRDHAFQEACRIATRLTAISNYSKQTAIEHGNLPADKIKTIYLQMATRTHNHQPALGSILESYKLKPQHYLIYPANFWLHKNHEMLLSALSMAYHQQKLSTNIKLVCTGAPGQRQQWLIDASAKMGLKEQVIFTGYLEEADLDNLLKNCAGMIFPSLYEGFGLPILEAMAAGVPVACSNITSLPEIADSAAIYFDPRQPQEMINAMSMLVNDKVKREELVKHGQERVTNFCDSSQMAREYWQLFEDACQSL